MTLGNDVGLLQGQAEPDYGLIAGIGKHHPEVERWRPLVEFFFSQVGYPQETDYALMVMWGESGGNPKATGPTVRGRGGAQTQGRGLFQHMDNLWTQRVAAAQQYWRSRGISIGNNIADPATNVAVAAYLRAVGGWGHWAVTYDWYKPGAWTDQTYWDGYAYQNLGVPPTTIAPRGDGQVAGQQGSMPATTNSRFIHPLAGYAPTGYFGDPRDGGARSHAGVDFGAPDGVYIRATAGGRVVSVGPGTRAAGQQVTIDHGNGWSSFYCHIQPGSFRVHQGQVVAAGDIIAQVGHTGNADGPHLHFQINYQGKALDPLTLGVTDNLDPDRPSDYTVGAGSGGGQASGDRGTFNRRDRLRAALLGSLDAISLSVAGGLRAPLPGSVPNWAAPTESGQTEVSEPAPLSPEREEVV